MEGRHSGRSVSRRGALKIAGAVGVGTAASLALSAAASAQPQGPQGPQSVAELTRVAEDVYMFRSVGHNGLIILTDEGVIVADPVSQNKPFSAPLYRSAIASLTKAPVRYMVYSHDHADHATGGAIFADTAQFVSQRRAAPKIAAQNNPDNPVPDLTFEEYLSLELGGKTVELHYTGRNHSDNSLVLVYPARRLAFAVDFIPVNQMPFRTLGDSYPDEWVQSLAWIEANLDFDTLVPGHGPIGTKENVRLVREYLLELMASIRKAQAQGLADNSEEMVAAVRAELAPKYGRWDNFGPYLPENIQGLLRDGFAMT